MTRRFSARELTFLRNQVPINRVIETLPSLAHSGSDRRCFACPLCHGTNTSINAKHNLGRCFDCRKNFNPIELVMHQLQLSFVDSVKWLKQRSAKPSEIDPVVAKTHRHKGQLAAIGDILTKMVPTLADKKTETPSMETLTRRISNLEHDLKQLYLQVQRLQSSLNHR